MRRFALTVVLTGFVVGATAATGSAKTIWLCKPGQRADPCAPGLSTTVYGPALTKLRVEHPKRVAHPAIDCFYVYPTVSDQTTGNSNREIQPEERSIALYQAARFSQYCRVFAPMYRQYTIAALNGASTSPPSVQLAYHDIKQAFETYVHKYNHGRGFVLIGHSQGSLFLRTLIAKVIDPNPALRRLLVSAILPGANVLVKRGKDVGGDFKHIHACHSARQLSCVIAYSTFDQPPPPNTLFGVPLTLAGGPTARAGETVLCTNPAALGGGSGLLDPIGPSAPFAPGTLIAAANAGLHFAFPHPHTEWWSAPRAYRARCETIDGATVLEVGPLHGAPALTPSPSAAWGLHLVDINLSLGNLVSIVHSESAAFVASGR